MTTVIMRMFSWLAPLLSSSCRSWTRVPPAHTSRRHFFLVRIRHPMNTSAQSAPIKSLECPKQLCLGFVALLEYLSCCLVFKTTPGALNLCKKNPSGKGSTCGHHGVAHQYFILGRELFRQFVQVHGGLQQRPLQEAYTAVWLLAFLHSRYRVLHRDQSIPVATAVCKLFPQSLPSPRTVCIPSHICE